jgi:Protein of unknown function (DUF2934)
MPVQQATTVKRSTRKAIAAAGSAKPKKTAPASKPNSPGGEQPVGSAMPRVGAATATVMGAAPVAKKAKIKDDGSTAASAAAPVKPRKVAPAAKAAGTPSENAVRRGKAAGAPSSAKAGTKAPMARQAATTQPEAQAKEKAPTGKKSIRKPAAPSQEERRQRIATAAYHRAERRGFAPGHQEQDWLDAEAEINELIGQA